MTQQTARVVHGFAIVSLAFWPLLGALRRRSIDASLCRYPSVGLPLEEIARRVADDLVADPPDGIVAHSLGCVATLLAVERVGWAGPIVLLAPPMAALPSTRFIPSWLRWPFAPLLDHRALMAGGGVPAPLPGCRVRAIAGRYDIAVPPSRTRSQLFEGHRTLPLTHNGLLFSSVVADLSAEWLSGAGNPITHAKRERPPTAVGRDPGSVTCTAAV